MAQNICSMVSSINDTKEFAEGISNILSYKKRNSII